tara:strand:- start:147 stop:584 length:438 start_codon:yes stop_codon:yes gene_type:complete
LKIYRKKRKKRRCSHAKYATDWSRKATQNVLIAVLFSKMMKKNHNQPVEVLQEGHREVVHQVVHQEGVPLVDPLEAVHQEVRLEVAPLADLQEVVLREDLVNHHHPHLSRVALHAALPKARDAVRRQVGQKAALLRAQGADLQNE